MKKLLFFCLLLQLVCVKGYSAVGDSIKVKAHQDVVIQTDPGVGYTNYPVWAEFPAAGKQYYKVYAYLTFECAPGMNCGEWDYINSIFIGRKGGVNEPVKNWEIGRFITPYGKSWTSFKHGWYYDMTDFAPMLHDSVELVYQHTGYETNVGRGWKINLSFVCIEGTPALPVTKIDTAWHGSFRYGDAADPVENHLDQRTVTLEGNTNVANIKIIQTGHGMDAPENCAEFCPKQRTVKFDGSTADERLIWKECGFNSLFPQDGTWLYDRTNWCPGQSVENHDIYIQNLTGGSTHTMDVDMTPYVSNSNTGNYFVHSYLVQYAAPTYTNDASLEAIIAPSKEYEFLRLNPICGSPIIVIKNNGKAALTKLDIVYGLAGGTKTTYSWTGNLGFMKMDTVYLNKPMSWANNAKTFEVELKNPNGQADEFTFTDKGATSFDNVTVLPDNKLIVMFKTNSAPTENYYYIKDAASGAIIYKHENYTEPNKIFRDTVNLAPGNCYSFEFYDDGPPPAGNELNRDGLSWWANTADGSGYVRLNNSNGTTFKSFGADFGTKIIYQFSVLFPTGVNDAKQQEQKAEVYPNPSNGIFTLDYALQATNGVAEVYSITGTKVFEQKLNQATGNINIDLSGKAKGIYILKMTTPDAATTIRKLIVE